VLFGTLLVPVLCRLLLPPWQVRKPLLARRCPASPAGWPSAGSCATAGRLPMDHGRWALTVPGWLFAPVFAVLVAAAVWRIGA
jgi:Cu(I)/Ag(I) efflux system membrane protein CusA/SilA